MRELIIGKNDAGQRLDSFLMKTLPALPPALAYKSIRTKKIKVNRARASLSQRLNEGDSVQCFIKEEFFASLDKPDSAFTALCPRLELVYEDSNLLLADKRPGMLSHSGEDGEQNTLIDHIKAYLYRRGEYDPASELSFAPALCNRIDRNTGGIVIAAKNAQSLRILNQKIRDREIGKYYLCAVHGIMEKKTDTLSAYLFKDTQRGEVTIYEQPGRGRSRITTEYRVVDESGGLSLLEVKLITGKTHQIRSHLAHVGHPLLGDGKYGVNRDDRRDGYRHQALYSYRVVFDFKTDAGILNYLRGREFEVKRENIYFLREFTKG